MQYCCELIAIFAYFSFEPIFYDYVAGIFMQYCCELIAIFVYFSLEPIFYDYVAGIFMQYFKNIFLIFNTYEFCIWYCSNTDAILLQYSWHLWIQNLMKKKHDRSMQYCIHLAGCCCDIIATSECSLARYMQYCIHF